MVKTRVRVVFGTTFARLAGASTETLELEESTIDGLVRALTLRHNHAFREALVGSSPTDSLQGVALLVNGSNAVLDRVLQEGDEVFISMIAAGG